MFNQAIGSIHIVRPCAIHSGWHRGRRRGKCRAPKREGPRYLRQPIEPKDSALVTGLVYQKVHQTR